MYDVTPLSDPSSPTKHGHESVARLPNSKGETKPSSLCWLPVLVRWRLLNGEPEE